MTFAASEQSASNASPVEVYDFALGLQIFRYTTGEESVIVDSNTYTPLEISRSSVSFSQEQQGDVISIRLPASNNLVRRFINNVPGQQGTLTIRRLHRTDNTNQTIVLFKGIVRSVAFTLFGKSAEILVQPITAGLSRTMPRYNFSGVCNHVLFDTGCKINSAAFRHIEVIDGVSSNVYTIRNLSAGRPNGWATGGFVQVGAGSDFRLIVDHVGDNITLQTPFPSDIGIGTEVQVFAGCDHSISVCSSKFNNVPNFGGFNWVPRENVFVKGV